MKKGTFIINPYVRKYVNGKIHPLYKTMFLRRVDGAAVCLTYEGKRTTFSWDDVLNWDTDGNVNVETELIRLFFGGGKTNE